MHQAQQENLQEVVEVINDQNHQKEFQRENKDFILYSPHFLNYL